MPLRQCTLQKQLFSPYRNYETVDGTKGNLLDIADNIFYHAKKKKKKLLAEKISVKAGSIVL